MIASSIPILDVACGGRMFWFDKTDNRTIFLDNRQETHILKDATRRAGSRRLVVQPNCVASFTDLPFADESFALVVFDPPHLERAGSSGWMAKKYGVLQKNWRAALRLGFSECFRVLRPEGTLIFKWSSVQIPLSKILALTPGLPLFGHRSGKQQNTHWVTFMKDGGLTGGAT